MVQPVQPMSLRPHDVCVALQLVIAPEITYRHLAEQVGLSLGEAHNSAKRLEVARLVLPHRKAVNKRSLLEFLLHGVPYAFPGELGSEVQGVPTAYSAPLLRKRISSTETVVWPSARGEARGLSLAPLCSRAAELLDGNLELYNWLTVVDAVRIGRARERSDAHELLEAMVMEGMRVA